jgi:predicted Zn-dependent protease
MGEKKRRLSALPPGVAPFDRRLLLRAFEALEAGDRGRASAAFETLQANLPDDPDALNAIGILGLRLGDPQRALAPLVRAVESSPRAPAIRCHLAIAYRSLAQPIAPLLNSR